MPRQSSSTYVIEDRSGQLVPVLRRLVGSGAVKDLVDLALHHGGHDLAGYEHQNHFDKLVLASVGDAKLVLHDWKPPPADRRSLVAAYDVHNHRWPFASVVLCGVLVLETFEPRSPAVEPVEAVEPAPAAFATYEHRYASPGARETFSFVFSGARKALALTSMATCGPGQYFSVSVDEHHRAYPRPGPRALTLVLQDRPVRTTTTVYVADGPIDEGSRPAPPIPPTRARRILRRAQHALARHDGTWRSPV